MKLVYSISGKIWWIHNFLPPDLYAGVHKAMIRERKALNLQTVEGLWGDDLIKNLTPPLRTEVKKYKPFEQIVSLIKHNPFHSFNVKETSTIIHLLKKNSGIQWHNDGNWKYGATLYMNHRWNKKWGGEFMFTDVNGHGFLPYVGNSLVLVKSPLEHKVNTVLSPLIPRMTIQLFMK